MNAGRLRLVPVALFLILLTVALAYSNHFDNEFHFDDSHTIEENAYIRSLRNLPLFFTDAKTFSSLPSNQSYRPLIVASLAFDYWMGGGLKPQWFHFSMFVLYLAQLVLMYVLFHTVLGGDTRSRFWALFGVAWYGLHTANAETINYIISRSDSYSTFFIVLAMVAYLKLRGLWKYSVYLIPAALACLCKESAAVFPAILALYAVLFEEPSFTAPLRNEVRPALIKILRILPAFVVCGGLLLFSRVMAPQWVPGGIDRWAYVRTQAFSIVHYLNTFFLPLGLSADTDWKLIINPFDDRLLVGYAALVALIIAAWFASKQARLRPVTFGLGWFFIALLPTTLVPLSEVINDHRTFFPYIGLCLAVVSALRFALEDGLGRSARLRVAALTLAAVLLGAHGHGVWTRNRVWKTEESLWLDVTVKSPENGRGNMNYGLTQMEKGNYAAAEEYFKRAEKLWPYYHVLKVNLAILNGALHRDAEAERYFKEALTVAPDYPAGRYFYANWLKHRGRAPEAIQYAEEAQRMSPAYLDPKHLLLELYGSQNQWDKVEETARAALAIDAKDGHALRSLELATSAANGPSNEQLFQHAYTLLKEKKYQESIAFNIELVRRAPRHAEAYNNMAVAYMELKEWDEAINAATQALLIKPDFELAKNNLNWAVRSKRREERAK